MKKDRMTSRGSMTRTVTSSTTKPRHRMTLRSSTLFAMRDFIAPPRARAQKRDWSRRVGHRNGPRAASGQLAAPIDRVPT